MFITDIDVKQVACLTALTKLDLCYCEGIINETSNFLVNLTSLGDFELECRGKITNIDVNQVACPTPLTKHNFPVFKRIAMRG